MPWSYDYFVTNERASDLDARVKANDIQRFDAAEEKKAISVRLGITEARRSELITAQNKILANCLAYKVRLMIVRGTPMADPTNWSYTNNLFSAQDRNARRTAKLRDIEVRYHSLERDRDRTETVIDPAWDVIDQTTGKSRRMNLIDGINTQLASLEAEKAERIRDQTSP